MFNVKGSIKIVLIFLAYFIGLTPLFPQNSSGFKEKATLVLKDSILLKSNQYLHEQAQTIIAFKCERSAGGIHDFYSEGDYWWPDFDNPEGPYIRRDGLSNPGNFNAHRELLIRFSSIVGNLTSAYLITQNSAYLDVIVEHLEAWFVNDSTRMNPDLKFAQAIKGRYTGRGIGIIDAIHFMEIAQSVIVLEKCRAISAGDLIKIKGWFAQFVHWLTTSEYGKTEMVHPNNHSSWWNAQVAVYAKLIGNKTVSDLCRHHFTTTILPRQMATDGSFPKELKRTKPYAYSLFNLEGMVMNCLILTDDSTDLWIYQTKDGKSVKKAIRFMAPFVDDKSKWQWPADVMYWEYWPVGQPSFLFGAIEFYNDDLFEIWKNHRHFYENKEVIRNIAIRNPLIWFDDL